MKKYLKQHLSDALLVWFAIAWLGLVLIPLMANDYVWGLWIGIALCIFAIAWGITRIRRKAYDKN